MEIFVQLADNEPFGFKPVVRINSPKRSHFGVLRSTPLGLIGWRDWPDKF